MEQMTLVEAIVAMRELTARVMAAEQVVLGTLDPKQKERYFHQVEENRRGLGLPPIDVGGRR